MEQNLQSGKSELKPLGRVLRLEPQEVESKNLSAGDEYERECRIHGKYSARVILIDDVHFLSGCPKCVDDVLLDIHKLGHEPEPLDRSPQDEKLEKFKNECKRIEKLIDRPRYPLAYGGCEFGKNPQNFFEASGFAEAIIRGKTRKACFLTGGSRMARAEFCAFVLQSVRGACKPVLWTDTNSMVTDILSTWSDDRRCSEDAMIDVYKRTPVLILDEFGMQAGFQKKGKMNLDYLRIVLMDRLRNYKPTILSTQCSLNEIDRFDWQLAELIEDHCHQIAF